jgi:hypothetical protein
MHRGWSICSGDVFPTLIPRGTFCVFSCVRLACHSRGLPAVPGGVAGPSFHAWLLPGCATRGCSPRSSRTVIFRQHVHIPPLPCGLSSAAVRVDRRSPRPRSSCARHLSSVFHTVCRLLARRDQRPSLRFSDFRQPTARPIAFVRGGCHRSGVPCLRLLALDAHSAAMGHRA